MRAQRLLEHTLPDYAPIKNKRNNYGYDRTEQETLTYTGMGVDINVHDQWACESMGAVQDRTREHLGTTDKAIVLHRRKLRKAMAVVAGDGRRDQLPLHVDEAAARRIRGPVAIDAIGPTDGWEACWRERDARRRHACDWKADL
jgi:hypothetical protein